MTPDELSTAGGSDVADDDDQSGPGPRRRASVVLAGVALAVLIIDLVSKELAVRYLEGRESVRILWGAVYLLLTRNSGAAFSLAADYTFVFPIVAIVVSGWIIWLAMRLRSVPWAVSLGLVLGGTVGNLIDRLFRAPGPFVGHVVDFISVFDPAGQGFPVFNAADSALCVGVGLAVLLEVTGRRRDGTRLVIGTPAPASTTP
ncbi:MAG: signal peptidase II, partial [Micromonosporaceae bacterium]|nr:signal peptidase II [Micromonosporaceae bacterium]